MNVPTDAVDAIGRRYLEVPPFPDGALKRAFEAAEPDICVDCGKPVRHAFERYYQRNTVEDTSLLLAMTYDCVCATCGDAALKEDAI